LIKDARVPNLEDTPEAETPPNRPPCLDCERILLEYHITFIPQRRDWKELRFLQ